MKKGLNTIILFLLAILVASCDKEEDDLIPQPTETSTILTGRITTPEGTPLANIPVAVDYTVKSILGTSLIHKAKGTTDKSGFYKIFFEFPEDGNADVLSSLDFLVDLSALPSNKYFIASKLDLGFPNTNEWNGKAIECNFTIPRKTNVKATLNNQGQGIKDGDYAVRNKIPFFSCDFAFSSGGQLWSEYNDLYWFEDVEIPQNGSTSLMLPCAIGVTNSIQVVYRGTETVRYGIGIPCSDMKELRVTANSTDEIVFDYFTPETPYLD